VDLNYSNFCTFFLLLKALSDANNYFCQARSDVWIDLLINLADCRDEWQSFVATVIEMQVPKVSENLVKSRPSVCEDSMRTAN
jgi:hypothetical protein